MKAKDDCYKLIQEIAVTRDVFCQRPGCTRKADCGHHIFPGRGKIATDFLPEAILGVCTQDHTGWCHNQPAAFKKFMVEKLGERYYELRRLSYTHVEHPDYTEIREELRRMLEDLKDVNSPF